VERSTALFLVTSAASVAAMIGAGVLLATGIGAGPSDWTESVLPIAGAVATIAVVLAIPRAVQDDGVGWAQGLVHGIRHAQRALRSPSWRLLGAVGYLGFDIAVLWATFRAVGYPIAIAPLVLGYLIGYLANLVPIPGGVGILDAGLAGTLVLYGAPATQAAAAVLIYHAIAFWVPALGGLIAYSLLRRRLIRLIRPVRANAAAPAVARASRA
jgi:uncharacterized membrane protein YbhN (UPF0104 family)